MRSNCGRVNSLIIGDVGHGFLRASLADAGAMVALPRVKSALIRGFDQGGAMSRSGCPRRPFPVLDRAWRAWALAPAQAVACETLSRVVFSPPNWGRRGRFDQMGGQFPPLVTF
ncbi:hypothetical protein EIB18_18065 [Caulobacter vibrioides]|uniref:Uncharacterized protein n=1 Tax=Caulobacter vibrioides (strain NA1000 / CB15N) TaxID=565050 RepID=A0A0H3CCG9_CAUVN|nr:hypothetical protein [Caulobacter vibrioides]YP_002518898.1 hypothetical protein CCNA_03525 [Caulobacter vibrioides NA1000]ACL96990.1 hypothetical protein CCNA_03525 [Caulobacter vibrioides NA1000]ATC26819.1 hypothetical protein CA608_17960 [Caulobacter vibrioides]ATC30727.1 hypothetical protein CA607_18320 [Caulobacter vibrioides]AZH14420.1 hypothetical protein EIB18_18065 [Caulobacter vibrioides]PLR11073.1 hypothetical protein CVUC_12315 [Caulobacter vibrioides]